MNILLSESGTPVAAPAQKKTPINASSSINMDSDFKRKQGEEEEVGNDDNGDNSNVSTSQALSHATGVGGISESQEMFLGEISTPVSADQADVEEADTEKELAAQSMNDEEEMNENSTKQLSMTPTEQQSDDEQLLRGVAIDDTTQNKRSEEEQVISDDAVDDQVVPGEKLTSDTQEQSVEVDTTALKDQADHSVTDEEASNNDVTVQKDNDDVAAGGGEVDNMDVEDGKKFKTEDKTSKEREVNGGENDVTHEEKKKSVEITPHQQEIKNGNDLTEEESQSEKVAVEAKVSDDVTHDEHDTTTPMSEEIDKAEFDEKDEKYEKDEKDEKDEKEEKVMSQTANEIEEATTDSDVIITKPPLVEALTSSAVEEVKDELSGMKSRVKVMLGYILE